jgi:hypothetical protein
MPKGKPWTIQAEKDLRRFIEEKRSLPFIVEKLGISEPAIRMKLSRLKLEVVDKNPTDSSTTTSKLLLPKHLPSNEKALKVLAAALDKSQEPGLDKVEVQRLQAVTNLARTYKELLADYIGYRIIEDKLKEMEEKYDRLIAKLNENKGNAPEPNKA